MLPNLLPWEAALAGAVVGLACGFVARLARFCSFGAIEDCALAGDTRRLKSFALALAVALAGTQALVALELLRPADVALLPPAFPWAGALGGGAVFGLGMALVGTCGFGALVRLGAGDLRALTALLVFAAAAWATASGSLSFLRLSVFDPLAFALGGGGGTSLPAALGAGEATSRWIAAICVLLLAGWTVSDSRLRRRPALLGAGLVVGLSVVAGWFVTAVLADPFEATPRPQGLSFVTPVARLLQIMVLRPGPVPEFAMGVAAAVPFGAALAAWRAEEFRWEAFDDAREMRRHLLGGALMGIGGVLAGGCTIGQGISAGSLMAPSWGFALLGIFAGARLGIAFLLEGRLPWQRAGA